MARTINNKKNSVGFTLIEIMISLIIFTIGIISIMYLFPISTRDSYRGRVMTQASFLAQAKMEEELSYPADAAPVAAEGNFGPEFPDFTYVVSKTQYNNNPALYQVRVQVFHHINNRQSPLVDFSTLKGVVGELRPSPTPTP